MLTNYTKSGVYPATLIETKSHLRVDSATDDTYISALIATATDLIEAETNCDLRTTSAVLTLDSFPSGNIVIERYPLTAITSVKYYNASNVLTTVSSSAYYVMIPVKRFGYLYPVDGVWDCDTYDRPDAVEITFTSGGSVPTIAKHAILLAVGAWYENRENEQEVSLKTLGFGYDRLLDQVRLMGVE